MAKKKLKYRLILKDAQTGNAVSFDLLNIIINSEKIDSVGIHEAGKIVQQMFEDLDKLNNPPINDKEKKKKKDLPAGPRKA